MAQYVYQFEKPSVQLWQVVASSLEEAEAVYSAGKAQRLADPPADDEDDEIAMRKLRMCEKHGFQPVIFWKDGPGVAEEVCFECHAYDDAVAAPEEMQRGAAAL